MNTSDEIIWKRASFLLTDQVYQVRALYLTAIWRKWTRQINYLKNELAFCWQVKLSRKTEVVEVTPLIKAFLDLPFMPLDQVNDVNIFEQTSHCPLNLSSDDHWTRIKKLPKAIFAASQFDRQTQSKLLNWKNRSLNYEYTHLDC